MKKERLQKILSQAGFGSRREIEQWIEQGLIEVNGAKAKLGDGADVNDKISVKGHMIANPLKKESKTRILLYHKPVGEISSKSDPKHSRTVFDKLPPLRGERWVQVGRLDINTSGLLIFTNNGELANRLMHPKFGLEREYAVRIYGEVSDEAVKNLLKGVDLEDGKAKFNRIEFRGGEGTNSWYHVTLSEGRNREVRRLWQTQGVDVSRLVRVRYGNLMLPRYLPRGQCKELSPKEVESFLSSLNKQ
ncbi:MAG: pseudouridine synthase [Proteobacteria bacterium]|nr:pseudouridine synthase [Pseudomonadota bacterium]